ncbi:MAG: transposase [Bacteroidia bacterium]|nr:MAG: transposase [Bacteroidia bacterium]
MLKSFKYRISPTKAQAELINKHIGSSRFVYNLALETKTMAYAGNQINLSCFDLIKQLPDLKKECTWLKEINSQSLQAPIRNLDNAFTRFYKGQGNFPKYKSKRRGKQSFHIPQNVIVENGKLIIPKFKEGIDIVLHRETKGVIKSATISRTSTGKYFVSILCDTKEEIPTKASITESTTIGIDLGIKDFAITSKGEVFENPKYLRKAQSKLKYVQRKYSKHKGKRTKKKLAKLHEDVVNKRKDFLHKVSTKLIRENQTIALETLAVKNILKNHNLAQSISDASWSTFVSMLEYKAEWYGKNILRIGRFAPSSKTCSCGVINKDLKLSDREWTCKSCGITHDRDILAACNIKSFALKNILSGTDRKNQDELPTLVGVLTPEAQPIASGVGG